MQKIRDIFKNHDLFGDSNTLDPKSDPLYKFTLSNDYEYLKICINFLSDVLDELENTTVRAEKYKAVLREIREEINKEKNR
jgi:hypothetical protein